MDQLKDQIRMLSIFHYVFAGMVGLFSLIPVIHLVVGLVFLFGDFPAQDPNMDNQLFGGIFAGVASFLIITGLTIAFLIFLAGKRLGRHTNILYCQVVAGVLCIFAPLGTILGVFTLILLNKPEAKQLFGV